jgi:hypothetical protein
MAKYVQVRAASDGELWRFNGGGYYVCKGKDMRSLHVGGSVETLRVILDKEQAIDPKWLRAYVPEIGFGVSTTLAVEGDNWKFIADDWVEYVSGELRKILDGFLEDMNGASAALDEFVRGNK